MEIVIETASESMDFGPPRIAAVMSGSEQILW